MAFSSNRRGGRSRLTIVLLVLTSITVLTLDLRGVGAFQDVRNAFAFVLDPFQGIANSAAAPFENSWYGVTNYEDVKAENEELRDSLAQVEAQLAEVQDLKAQYNALLQELDLAVVEQIPQVTAQVVQESPIAFGQTLIVDKGFEAGIRVGMPVISNRYLIGRVEQVSDGRALIQLVTDPDFRVGVRLVTSQEVGTASGRGQGNDLAIETGISPAKVSETVPAAEIVVTAGSEDGRSAFPAGIPVARVSGNGLAQNGLTVRLEASPLIDLNRISLVSVLLRSPSE